MITCLPSSQAVSEVVAGEDGIASRPARRRHLDRHEHERSRTSSSGSPRCSPGSGIATLECPVTGGVHRAAAGEITIIAGGDEAVFAAHRELLGALGGEVIHVGPLGKASVIKVITNMLAFIHLVAVGEALMLAKRGGVDLAIAYEVISASSARRSCTRPRAR